MNSTRAYRPETGVEGAEFMMVHCRRCKHVAACAIPLRTLLFTVHEDKYPAEWVCTDGGMPVCMKFERGTRAGRDGTGEKNIGKDCR